jgi:hypothetical protein
MKKKKKSRAGRKPLPARLKRKPYTYCLDKEEKKRMDKFFKETIEGIIRKTSPKQTRLF